MVSWMLLGLCIPNIQWSECDATFFKHLQVIKSNFYLGKTHKVDDEDMMVGELLNVNTLIASKVCLNTQ